ncbi:MAG: COX15/CtaA family protein [Candidatus Planktophila sp.]|jgi:heme a synthase
MRIRTALYGALFFLQGALVITGGAVRLTGSGLGCPTWPECSEGSFTPVATQIEPEHQVWIEFGNRLLTFALLIAALAVVIEVLKTKRRDLRPLAAGQLLGILAQGALGGITVLTGLHPLTVAAHLLLSMILIAGAASLYSRRSGPIAKTKVKVTSLRIISGAHLAISFLVLVLGTLVTGSGPHAGDESAERFGFDIQNITVLHSDAVIFLMGLTIAYLVLPQVTMATKRAIVIFLGISLGQGAIGYIQYVTGVPEILVAFHLLGAVLFWIAAWRIRLTVVRVPKDRKGE